MGEQTTRSEETETWEEALESWSRGVGRLDVWVVPGCQRREDMIATLAENDAVQGARLLIGVD